MTRRVICSIFPSGFRQVGWRGDKVRPSQEYWHGWRAQFLWEGGQETGRGDQQLCGTPCIRMIIHSNRYNSYDIYVMFISLLYMGGFPMANVSTVGRCCVVLMARLHSHTTLFALRIGRLAMVVDLSTSNWIHCN